MILAALLAAVVTLVPPPGDTGKNGVKPPTAQPATKRAARASAPSKPAASSAPANVACTIREVREVRSVETPSEPADKDSKRFKMPSDRPGLQVHFEADLPEGLRILAIEQPPSVKASDSTGRDLTAIEANVFGHREYLQRQQVFFEEKDNKLTLTLASPARAAASVSVALEAELLVYRGTETHKAALDSAWADLPFESLDAKPLRCKVARTKQGVKVHVEGRGAESVIEKCRLVGLGEPVDSTSRWTTNDTSTIFDIDASRPPSENAQVEIVYRTGIERRRLSIDWQELPLP